MAGKTSKKRGRKGSKKTDAPSVEIRGTGMRLGLAIAALMATAICLLIVLILPPDTTLDRKHGVQAASAKDQATEEASREVVSAKRSSGTGDRALSAEDPGERVFEETVQADFERRIREVDLALVQCLILENINPDRLHHDDVQKMSDIEGEYYHQSLSIHLQGPKRKDFLSELRSYLSDWVEGARLETVRGRESAFVITVYDKPTHRLTFRSSPIPTDRRTGPEEPRLAIVIDDLGESLAKARELASILGDSLTWSILPNCTYTEEIVGLASREGVDILLHLPMEPLSYPEVDPGPGGLFVDMDRQTIRRVLKENLEQVSGAVGVNNHMGSRFTEHEAGMRAVLSLLKQRRLFFMDSLTNPGSLGRSLAGELRLPHVSRDIFIDNEQRVEAIVFQLQKAGHMARKSGRVIAIGHPYPETIEALRRWSMERKGDIALCSLSALVDDGSASETQTALKHTRSEETEVW